MPTSSDWLIYQFAKSSNLIGDPTTTVSDPTINTSDTVGYTLQTGEHFLVGGVNYIYDGVAIASDPNNPLNDPISGFLAHTSTTTKSGVTKIVNYFFTQHDEFAEDTRAVNLQYETDPVTHVPITNPTTGAPIIAQDTVICFYPGTLIRTPAGEQAVETLAIGDLVTTATGEAKPVRWVGRQTVSTRFGDPLRVLPIRIAAGALDENLPLRDLLVSPDHALMLDGVLVQAGALVNGSTIRREPAVPSAFTYVHVELADHALILAEGVAAETFVDNVGRMGFDNWDEHEALYGAAAPIAEMELPRAKAQRQVPPALRARIAARAETLAAAA